MTISRSATLTDFDSGPHTDSARLHFDSLTVLLWPYSKEMLHKSLHRMAEFSLESSVYFKSGTLITLQKLHSTV